MSDDLQDLGAITTLFRERPNWIEPVNTKLVFTKQLLNFPGASQTILGFTSDVPQRLSYNFLAPDKETEFNLITFWRARKARVEAFWAFGHRESFTLSQDALLNDASITVLNNGFLRAYRGYERIYIELKSGDILTRKIVAVAETGGGAELLLQLGTVLDRDIDIIDIRIIARLFFGRFDSDQLEMAGNTNTIDETTLEFFELVKEYP